VTLSASGRERAGQGSADAHVAVRVEPDGASARVLITADLMIRGTVAQYAPGAIGEVSQRLVEQFAGNVERLLASQAGPSVGAAARAPALPAKRAAAAAVLLGAGVLTALAIWRMRARAISPLNDSSQYYPHGGARHG
jgi:hypothetical protein